MREIGRAALNQQTGLVAPVAARSPFPAQDIDLVRPYFPGLLLPQGLCVEHFD